MSEAPRMLLVDDDTTLCAVLARAFENRGYATSVAHAGAQALQQVVRDAPDTAVIDLRLPDMSGLKVVQALMTANPNARVVVLTGFGSIATAIDAIKLGALSYLSKPVNADQIVAALQPNAPDVEAAVPERPLSVDRVEWEYIQRVLVESNDNISAAARSLNMHRRTLQRKLSKHPPKA